MNPVKKAALVVAAAGLTAGTAAGSAAAYGYHHDHQHGLGHGHTGADTTGVASNSPGVLSGNTVQMPIDIPVNLSNNSINVIGLLNPVMGNASEV
ncbi:chaplin [Streptomyces sp. NPDC003077]|uniref:chaplin n=1 Tax=Streptomyces sp. NPDC003077 TaxID=3154443 RepID=UPI0033BC5C49